MTSRSTGSCEEVSLSQVIEDMLEKAQLGCDQIPNLLPILLESGEYAGSFGRRFLQGTNPNAGARDPNDPSLPYCTKPNSDLKTLNITCLQNTTLIREAFKTCCMLTECNAFVEMLVARCGDEAS